jgi:hypothetical protein
LKKSKSRLSFEHISLSGSGLISLEINILIPKIRKKASRPRFSIARAIVRLK